MGSAETDVLNMHGDVGEGGLNMQVLALGVKQKFAAEDIHGQEDTWIPGEMSVSLSWGYRGGSAAWGSVHQRGWLSSVVSC